MMPQFGLENTKFILPTASSIPISINGGMEMNGWSDIHGLSMDATEDRKGFDLAAARVNAIIRSEIEKGIPASKIAIGGFSQGGALALHVSLRSPNSFAGCVALSTWLPLRDDYPEKLSPAAKSLPIFQVNHNSSTMTVITAAAAFSCDVLKAWSVPLHLSEITHQNFNFLTPIATFSPITHIVPPKFHHSDVSRLKPQMNAQIQTCA